MLNFPPLSYGFNQRYSLGNNNSVQSDEVSSRRGRGRRNGSRGNNIQQNFTPNYMIKMF